MKRILLSLFAALFCLSAQAATHYVRQGATGSTGNDWVNAYTDLPATLVRGDTYYVAGGSYGSHSFNDTQSGSTVITVKKATVADHGTATGWSDSYGTSQALFSGNFVFYTGYYTIDGNGSFTIPSKNTTDYGIRIANTSTSNHAGTVAIGWVGSPAVYITLRYCHISNAYNGSINYDIIAIRWYPSSGNDHTKVQNCYIQNSCTDGLQLTAAKYVLIERCYCERLGRLAPGTPDYHGQSIQLWTTVQTIMRWNVFDSCEGQGLVSAVQSDGSTVTDVRFYGNVIFVPYSTPNATPGFNGGGGILSAQPKANGASFTRVYCYNNTHVNVGTNGNGVCGYPGNPPTIWQNCELYNNLFYNCYNIQLSGLWAAVQGTASGHGATEGSSGEQTGLTAAILQNYAGNDFRLTGATQPGITLTSKSWWNTNDSFFGYLDSNVDMYGNVRGADGTWDRGAFEFTSGAGQPPSVTIQPSNVNTYTNVPFTLSLTAAGSAPLAYQWYNAAAPAPGNAISGATAASYSSYLASPSTNSYCCTVTNSYGSTTSQVATVAATIVPQVPILSLNVLALDFGNRPTNTLTSLSIAVSNAGFGTLSCSVTSSAPWTVTAGSSLSLAYGQSDIVTVRFAPGASQGVYSGNLGFVGYTNIPLAGLAYRVFPASAVPMFSGVVIAPYLVVNGDSVMQYSNNNASVQGSGEAIAGFNLAASNQVYLIAGVEATNNGNWSYYINVDGEPIDSTMKCDVTNTTPAGTLTDRVVSWRGPLGDDTHPQYVTNVWGLGAGDHYIVVRGNDPYMRVGTIGVYGNSPAVILTSPSDAVSTVGSTATFSVVANGTPPISYQWKWYGTNVSGATSSTWTTPALTLAHSGSSVSVAVSNAYGSANSSTATLTVNPAGTVGTINATTATIGTLTSP